MEKYSLYRVVRGGDYNASGSLRPASNRSNGGDVDYINPYYGFRITLYIK